VLLSSVRLLAGRVDERPHEGVRLLLSARQVRQEQRADEERGVGQFDGLRNMSGRRRQTADDRQNPRQSTSGYFR